jgi:hypothetical protein
MFISNHALLEPAEFVGVRRNGIELDVSPLLQGLARNPGQALETEQSETDQARSGVGEISQSPVTFLSVSHMDLFFQYLINMGHREYELYDHREQKRLFKRNHLTYA